MLEETFSLDAASPFVHVCYLHGFRHVQRKNAAFKGESYTVRAGNSVEMFCLPSVKVSALPGSKCLQ